MKYEVRCERCGKGYLVDEDSLGGEFPCPGCLEPIRTASVVPPPEPGPDPAAASGPATTAAPTPVEEVVCPRCKLHFVPRSGATAPAAPATSSDRPVVLVVEDMSYFREIAKDALEPEYEVRTATSRQEALAALDAGGIDAMVLDLTLDGGDHGLDLLRSFASKPCRILIYTAKDESEMYGDGWEELKRLGADDIVIKGMNVGESLARKVDALLGREREDTE